MTLAAPSRFKELVEGYGIRFIPLAGEPEDLSRRLNDAGYNFFKLIRELMNHAVEIGADVLRQTEEACAGTDLIIHTFSHAVGAHTLAREMNVSDIHIQTFPMFMPTGDYPNIALPDLKLPLLNRFTHTVSQRFTWWTSKIGYEQVRRRAGLPKRKLYFPFDEDPLRPPTPILCAWSPSILPPSNDWKPNVHVTGYYFFNLNTNYQPTSELQDFLNSGDAPICVSFGSMVNRDAEKIDRTVREALKNSRQRGIVLSGWGGVKHSSSKDLLYLDAVPHDWLLSQCRMIVHHGGAGTTSAGLRAGIPQVIVPFIADQPFWARRVHAIGVGTRPILVKNLSVENLTQALFEAESNVIRERAQEIGRKIRSEDGVGEAIKLIESIHN